MDLGSVALAHNIGDTSESALAAERPTGAAPGHCDGSSAGDAAESGDSNVHHDELLGDGPTMTDAEERASCISSTTEMTEDFKQQMNKQLCMLFFRIAEVHKLPHSTTEEIFSDFKAFRDDRRLWNLPRGHRQWATDSAKDLLIVQAAKEAPFTTARQIKDSLNLSGSMSTIRRRLHEKGLRSRLPAQKPGHSEANKLARLGYAQEHAAWTVDDWRCVIFTDESTFSTRWDQRQRIWRTDNARRRKRCNAAVKTERRNLNDLNHSEYACRRPSRLPPI
ncbi:hypothetical protein HPB50_010264 [Hyalomma asiaticum]|uniref:Uncharacterized protein n=1 Tax=Hyalomma asiaticum TaxID=266040 RepID=A0ACB7TFQ3_HYAAI|nr:hypothetical protein HPB50_010264 [Hyalomma asiaticum]